MKSWLYLLTLGLLLSSATLAESPVPSKLAEHHALIGSAGNHVEIYWAVPPPGTGKAAGGGLHPRRAGRGPPRG